MADILIRGMEIPKNEPLTITITPEGKVFRAFIPGSYGEVIPLPEGYGRLIDADDALKKIPIPTGGVSSVDIYNNIEYFIETRPTIVPAEGGYQNEL